MSLLFQGGLGSGCEFIVESIFIMMEWLKSRQRVKYEGKYSFHLLLNTEQVDSSSTISITCFTDKTQRAAVPCNYIWFVIKNGLPQEVPDFRGCTFICDTACIGYYVQAHIISNDPECSGKAIVTFGPVELDVSLKTAILSAQSLGRLELPVYFVGPEQEEKEGTLELTDSQIRLAHNFSEANYVFEYSIVEPQITPNSREVSKASFFFNEKYEAEMRRFERKLFAPNDLTTSKSHKVIISRPQKASNTAPKLEVKFLSRSARDTFFFAMKAFIAKKEIRNSAVIRKIESINFEREEDFNAILEIDNLKCDLMRYDRLYKQALQEKRRLQEEVGRLERELERAKPELSMNVNYSATTRREEAPKRDASQMHFSLKLKKLNDQIEHARNTSAILEPQMALSPFSRLKEDDNESLVGLLADLSHCQPERRIERLEQEKRSLQLRLERSFEKINQLEQQRLRPSLPGSGINFTYKNSLQLPLDKGLEQLRLENAELRRLNSDLQHQNQQLKERLEWEAKSSRAEGIKIESHLTKIRDQNRTTDMLIEQERAMRLGAQVSGLRLQMSSKEKELQDVLEKCAGLQRRVQEAEMEAEMFRKNQDVLNRSQHMSQQMESYNEEQIRMLKEHNGFLLEENEKLVRACEKYMTDAKQNNKLRQEIIVLKERITKLMTNPEASFQ